MKQIKTKRLFTILFTGAAMLVMASGMEACSKKSNASKTTTTTKSEPGAKENMATPPAPAAIKEGMQIKRDANGNYVIQLVLKDLEAVKLMKPAKEGYVVWIVNEANVTSNIGNIEAANTWTAKKDFVNFEATSTVKPVKVFITAETNLKVEEPGTQVVWSTKNF